MIYRKWIMLVSGALLFSSCAMGLRHNAFVDGAVIPYVSKGVGSPTVVFEAGLGDGLETWESIYNEVGVFANVFAYSRAGYSGSAFPSMSGSRSADDVAKAMKALLRKANVSAPYVLVGHSIGGMYMLRFAQLFPEDVAGIVLVDGRPKNFTRECEAAGLSPCAPPALLSLMAPSHVAAEIRGIPDTEKQTPTPQELGDIPVTVIVATEPPPGAPNGGQPLWLQVQKEFADALQDGRYVVAQGAGHYVHKDAPELVVDEIRSLMMRGDGGL